MQLPKIKTRKQKRLGLGYGSGKGGHTVGRGQKGQKSRAKLGILFEGYKMKKSLIKRLPLQRGRGKFKGRKDKIIVSLTLLNMLPSGSLVNLDALIKNGIVDAVSAKACGVKILGGKIDIAKKFTIEVPISHSAAKKIEKAGGKVN